MTPEIAYQDDLTTLWHGHVIDTLRALPSESVQMVVTSPPYFGLRAYSTDPVIWGGDPSCGHAFVKELLRPQSGGTGVASKKQVTNTGSQDAQSSIARGQCVNCNAWLGELGHETGPQMFVDHLILILREIRRVLKSSGVIFWNLGDSYAGSGKGPPGKNGLTKSHSNTGSLIAPIAKIDNLKPKDLMLIPERFAIAAQGDGWYVRSRIAWVKNNPMPESVTDRPTSSWEYIWMLTKSREYYWNTVGASEPAIHAGKVVTLGPRSLSKRSASGVGIQGSGNALADSVVAGETRNIRNAWVLNQRSFKGAHFATFNPEIPKRCIEIASQPGDIVLDPFAGAGTTNVVAASLGRKSIGIELQRKYLDDIAIPRIQKGAV